MPVDEPGHVYHMYVVRTPDRARIAAALTEAGIASASYYVTPLHLQPAMRYLGYGPGSLPETERAAADNLALPMWGGIGADVQEQVVATVLAAAGVAAHDRGERAVHVRARARCENAVQPACAVAGRRRRRDHRARLGARLACCASTRDARSTTTATSTGRSILVVVAIQLTVFALGGLLQPLVAVRLDARHVGGAARRRLRIACHVPRLHAVRVHPARVPTGVWFIDLLLCLAFVAGSRLLARTLIERPLPGQVVARGKEAIVVGAGDAAQLVVKEMLRNPGLGYTPIGLVDDDPRKRTCACTASACSARRPTCRA